MDIQLVQPIFDAIDNGLKGTLANGTTKMMSVVGFVVGIFWVLYIGMKSIYWYFEGLDVIVQDVFRQTFKVVFITFFAIGLQPYTTVVVPVVSNAPSELTKILIGSKVLSTNQVDVLINAFIETAINVANSLNFNIFTNPLSSVVAGLSSFGFLLLGGFAFLGVCIATLVVLKVSTTVFLAIGPIFIILALFEQTRQYFWGWVNLICGFMLTNLLFGVVIALEIDYINNNIMADNGLVKADWTSVLSMPLVFGAFTAIAQVLPNYAAQVMSGTPVSSAGGIRGMMRSNMMGINASMKVAGGVNKITSRMRNSIR